MRLGLGEHHVLVGPLSELCVCRGIEVGGLDGLGMVEWVWLLLVLVLVLVLVEGRVEWCC